MGLGKGDDASPSSASARALVCDCDIWAAEAAPYFSRSVMTGKKG